MFTYACLFTVYTMTRTWICSDVDTGSKWRTYKTAQGQLPAAHSLHKPDSHKGEHKVGRRSCSGQPDCLLIIPNPCHLQNGCTVVPWKWQRGSLESQINFHYFSSHTGALIVAYVRGSYYKINRRPTWRCLSQTAAETSGGHSQRLEPCESDRGGGSAK